MSLLADILIDKYVYHLPFYRIIQKYKELGVVPSDSMLGDWFSEVYEAYENAPGKRMIGCWAHARRKFVEAMDESKKLASG
ncbi:MAG: transposase [Bacteroidales bacterium]|nr:transposase [Bacteroidales bacterium]